MKIEMTLLLKYQIIIIKEIFHKERMEVIIILLSANKDEIFFLFLDNIFKISSYWLILDSKFWTFVLSKIKK